MEGALARSTMNTYQGAVTRYQEFCESAGYDGSDIPEESVLHYITYLGHQRAGLASSNTAAGASLKRPGCRITNDMSFRYHDIRSHS
jgi:site-specific recombinase XerD